MVAIAYGGIVLTIEMGADALENGKSVHTPSTLRESVGIVAGVAHGRWTQVPPNSW